MTDEAKEGLQTSRDAISVDERSSTNERLDRQLAVGIAWVGGLRLAAQFLSWSATLFVVRLISPSDYGVVGIASVYVGIVTLLVDSGISGAVVAAPGLTENHLSQLHTIACSLGAVTYVLSLALAEPLGAFFHEPYLPPIIAVMSASLLLAGLRAVPRAALQRELRYRSTAIVDAAKSVVQTITVLTGAIAGLGYWALTLGVVAGSLTATIGCVYSRRIRAARPIGARLAVALHYARNVFVGGLARQLHAVSDFIVIGRTRGSAALGYYTLAWNVASVPGERFTNFLSGVSSSFFASLRGNTPAMRRYFLLVSEGIAVSAFPILTGIAFVAADAVAVLWGDKWQMAVLPMRILAVHAMFNCLLPPLSQILVATGQVVAYRRNSLLTLAVLVPAFVVSATTLGIAGVAACWLILNPLLKLGPFGLVRASLGLSLREYGKALVPACIVTGAMLTALIVLRVGITRLLDAPERLIVETLSGAVTFCLVLRATYWNRLTFAWRTLRTASLTEGAATEWGASTAAPTS